MTKRFVGFVAEVFIQVSALSTDTAFDTPTNNTEQDHPSQ